MKDLAVVSIGGKQHLVTEGSRLVVTKIMTSKLELPDLLSRRKVVAHVVETRRSPKISVRKFKSKVRYLRRHGHRQEESVIIIDKIKSA